MNTFVWLFLCSLIVISVIEVLVSGFFGGMISTTLFMSENVGAGIVVILTALVVASLGLGSAIYWYQETQETSHIS